MTTLHALKPDEHNGLNASVTYGGTTRHGRLVHGQNPSYKIIVRHWFLAIPSSHPHFAEDALSLQWTPPDAAVEITEAAS